VGFDLELTERVANSVPIPVIACGGAGKISDVHDVVARGKADAVSIASLLHYQYVKDHYTDDDYSSEGNVAFLRGGRQFTRVQPATQRQVKDYLIEHGVACRPAVEEKAYV
jgi:cyclase